MANASILAAFERMWQHVIAVVGDKSDSDHTHDWVVVSDTKPSSSCLWFNTDN